MDGKYKWTPILDYEIDPGCLGAAGTRFSRRGMGKQSAAD